MADYDDVNQFKDQESRTDKPTDESIPLIPGEGGVPTWNPGREQETSFIKGEILRAKTKEELVEALYEKLSDKYERTFKAFFDDFDLRNGQLYYKKDPRHLTKIKGG